MPETTIKTEILPLQDTARFDMLFAEQLRRCHNAAMKCFDIVEEPGVHRDARTDLLTLASKMIKTSMSLRAMLRNGPKEFRRHVTIEHVTTPTPPPISKNGKTNSGGPKTNPAHG